MTSFPNKLKVCVKMSFLIRKHYNSMSAMFAGIQQKMTLCNLRKLLTLDSLLKCSAFACTGMTTAYCVPTIVKELKNSRSGLLRDKDKPCFPQEEGACSLLWGPPLYQLLYLSVSVPFYSFTLLFFGTLFGRGPYFMNFVLRMWSRFLPY